LLLVFFVSSLLAAWQDSRHNLFKCPNLACPTDLAQIFSSRWRLGDIRRNPPRLVMGHESNLLLVSQKEIKAALPNKREVG